MRTAFVLILVTSWFTSTGFAQPFRIATWQVTDLPPTTNLPSAGPDPATEIAASLSDLDADAIVLYGISDGAVLKRIGDLIKPRKHTVALHTVFRNGGSKGPIVGEPLAILSHRQKMHSKSYNWADSGRIELPGGFAFASFKHGAGVVAVYVAGLPGSFTNGPSSADSTYYSRKREYAANYMTANISWLATTYTNSVFATYLTGDINPSAKRGFKDDCPGIMEKAGFRSLLLGTVTDKSSASITNSQRLDRVLDPVFTRNVEFIASRQVTRPGSEHPLIICDLTLKSTGAAAAAAVPVKRSVSTPKPVVDPAPPKPVPAFEPSIASSPAPIPASERKLEPVAAVAAKPPAAVLASTPVPAAQSLPGSASAPAPGPAFTVAMPAMDWSILHEPWFGLTVAGAGAALMAVVFFSARATRRRHVSLALNHRPSDAVFVEVGRAAARPQDPDSIAAEETIVSEATTSTDNAHNALWQTPPVQVGSQAEQPEPDRTGLMPHLRRLMREKLFIWLSHQRSHLIDSHETGTRQVLGLEERLERIKEQFQDRLISQEERIAELDRELQAKEKFIHDAIKDRTQRESR